MKAKIFLHYKATRSAKKMPPLPNFVIPAVPTMEVRKEIQVVDVSSFNFKTRIMLIRFYGLL